MSTRAAIPDHLKACYAVNVTAADLPTAVDVCSPATGVVAGFAPANTNLEVIVPQGFSRKIELLMYLYPKTSTEPCPSITAKVNSAILNSVYVVGTVPSVNFLNAEETISIEVNFPGLSQHIAQQFSLPANCATGATPVGETLKGFYHSSAQGSADDGASPATIHLKARIGSSAPAIKASNANYILKGSIR